MKWLSRENANVDRIACPWLIRRFIDPEAEFLFAPRDQVLEVAKREGARSFDAPGAEYKALARLAEIVHAADVSEDRHSSPEGPGLYAIARGFALLHGTDDHTKIELETPLYDALYAWCQEQTSSP